MKLVPRLTVKTVIAALAAVGFAVGGAIVATGQSAPPQSIIRASDKEWLPGVNLAAGEFKRQRSKLWKDYAYPSTKEIDYYAGKGFRVLRIPFLAQRFIQPTLTQGSHLKDEVDIVEKLIVHAATRGTYVILDMHDYGKIFTKGIIGKDKGAVEEFATAWRLIAERMKVHPNVMFGIMNEPNKQKAAQWLEGANAAILAIRDTGATQMILVPGSYWTGAHSWMKTDNNEVMLGVVDPGNNFAYEVHQYLDHDSSGVNKEVVKGAGSKRLEAFTAWAREHKAVAFLGEFGWADSPEAHAEGDALLAHMSQNRDVWIGWSYWAGGPWWGDYMYSVEPGKDGADKPQMQVLEKYLK